MNAKHLPWVSGIIGTKGGLGPDCNDFVCAILRRDGGLVAEGLSADESAHIVLCVNAHDELIRELVSAQSVLDAIALYSECKTARAEAAAAASSIKTAISKSGTSTEGGAR